MLKWINQFPFKSTGVREDQVPSMFGWSATTFFRSAEWKEQGYRIKGGHGPNIFETMSATQITENGRPLKDGDELLLEFQVIEFSDKNLAPRRA
jgi:hypothetical protein